MMAEPDKKGRLVNSLKYDQLKKVGLEKYESVINYAANRYGLNPALVATIIKKYATLTKDAGEEERFFNPFGLKEKSGAYSAFENYEEATKKLSETGTEGYAEEIKKNPELFNLYKSLTPKAEESKKEAGNKTKELNTLFREKMAQLKNILLNNKSTLESSKESVILNTNQVITSEITKMQDKLNIEQGPYTLQKLQARIAGVPADSPFLKTMDIQSLMLASRKYSDLSEALKGRLGDKNVDKNMLDKAILDAQVKSKEALLQIRDLLYTSPTFNLPEGVRAMTPMEQASMTGNVKSMTTTMGGVLVNVKFGDVHGTSKESASEFGRTIASSIASHITNQTMRGVITQ
jgi:hypothetical protein